MQVLIACVQYWSDLCTIRQASKKAAEAIIKNKTVFNLVISLYIADDSMLFPTQFIPFLQVCRKPFGSE